VLIGLGRANASFVPVLPSPKLLSYNSLGDECGFLQKGKWRRVVARVQLIESRQTSVVSRQW
jgi:hypothetical protein